MPEVEHHARGPPQPGQGGIATAHRQGVQPGVARVAVVVGTGNPVVQARGPSGAGPAGVLHCLSYCTCRASASQDGGSGPYGTPDPEPARRRPGSRRVVISDSYRMPAGAPRRGERGQQDG